MIDDVENVEEDVGVVGVAQVDVVEVDDAQEDCSGQTDCN